MDSATVVVVIFYIASVYGACPKDCAHNKLTFLYESFNCTPQYSDSKDNCPTEYKCVDLNADLNTCYFNGNFYKPGENVQNSLTWEQCMGCSCGQDSPNRTALNCYYADCANFNVTPGCRLDQKLGECCYNSQICPPFQICTIDRQKHLQGDKFPHPSEKCTKCYCGKGSGNAGSLKCEKQYCLDLLHHQDKIRRNCAPLYQKTDTCCPSTWICPEEGTVTFDQIPNTASGPQCVFGPMYVDNGAKFSFSGELYNATCECILAPYFSCESTN